jgi:NAD(P)-dependent dehydrogenase (short-subunit alcohol dehydrogenase family)
MDDLKGRTAFITGAASGIGFAMAEAFAKEGMQIVVADIERAALENAENLLRQRGAEVLAIELDVTDRKAMAEAADASERTFGNVHVLCNNAGVAGGGPIGETATYADWDWVLGVNLGGVVNGIQTFVPRIKAHGEGGHIVNTASIAGLLSGPSVYSVSKHAVVVMSEGLHATLAPHGIGVSVLCPGFVETNIFDSARNRPESLGPAAAPMLSEEQRRVRQEQIRRNMVAPDVAAERVLDAIRSGALYVFTHPEFKETVQARFQRILEAFDDVPDPKRVS